MISLVSEIDPRLLYALLCVVGGPNEFVQIPGDRGEAEAVRRLLTEPG